MRNSTKQIIKDTKSSFGQPLQKDRLIAHVDVLFKVTNEDEKLLDDKTWKDLEMDHIFSFIDRTSSKTGEQYLYHLLHKKQPKEEQNRLNQKVKYYQNNFNRILSSVVLLKKYDATTSYSLPRLLHEASFYKIGIWPIFFGFLAIALGILSLFFKFFFIYFIVIGVVNTLLHYYFKRKINTYYNDFINIKSFSNLYLKLIANDNETEVLSNHEKKKLKTISKKCFYLTLNIEFADEFTAAFYYLLEIIKGWFLLDAIQFNRTVKLIEHNTALLQKVYCYIGLVDTAIAIASLKHGTRGCEPTFVDKEKISIVNAYHPLVENCIANSISLDSRNAIITGGNMSGKTTFLKTVGINIILSQTINYSFSDEIQIPRLNVMSSITNKDDLEKGQSYFMNELIRAKLIYETAESENSLHFILFDEIFKGTNSKDRIALASSMLGSLSKLNCFVVVTTHDLAIIDFIKQTYDTFYFNNSFKNDKIVFDYKIQTGIQHDTNVVDLIKSINFSDQIITETIKIKDILNKRR